MPVQEKTEIVAIARPVLRRRVNILYTNKAETILELNEQYRTCHVRDLCDGTCCYVRRTSAAGEEFQCQIVYANQHVLCDTDVMDHVDKQVNGVDLQALEEAMSAIGIDLKRQQTETSLRE